MGMMQNRDAFLGNLFNTTHFTLPTSGDKVLFVQSDTRRTDLGKNKTQLK